jgi:cysteinyl-tRNA synthetase
MLHTLGLENLLEPDVEGPPPEAVQKLEERETARRERDFATADARRDELAAIGWEVRDTAQGPQLVRIR